MELLIDVHHVETRLFGDNISFGARQVHSSAKHTIGSEIILDTPDGSPS
jgi:hypothetical protein